MKYKSNNILEKLSKLMDIEKDNSPEFRSLKRKVEKNKNKSYDEFIEMLTPAESRELIGIINPVDSKTGYRVDPQGPQSLLDVEDVQKFALAVNGALVRNGNKTATTNARNTDMTLGGQQFANTRRQRPRGVAKKIAVALGSVALLASIATGAFLGIENAKLKDEIGIVQSENKNLQNQNKQFEDENKRLSSFRDLAVRYGYEDGMVDSNGNPITVEGYIKDKLNTGNLSASEIEKFTEVAKNYGYKEGMVDENGKPVSVKDYLDEYLDGLTDKNKDLTAENTKLNQEKENIKKLLEKYNLLEADKTIEQMLQALIENAESAKSEEAEQAYANIVGILQRNGLELTDVFDPETKKFDSTKFDAQTKAKFDEWIKIANNSVEAETFLNDYFKAIGEETTVADKGSIKNALEYAKTLQTGKLEAELNATIKNMGFVDQTCESLGGIDNALDFVKSNGGKLHEDYLTIKRQFEELSKQYKDAGLENGNQGTAGSVIDPNENEQVSTGNPEDESIGDKNPGAGDELTPGSGSGSGSGAGAGSGSGHNKKDEDNLGLG